METPLSLKVLLTNDLNQRRIQTLGGFLFSKICIYNTNYLLSS